MPDILAPHLTPAQRKAIGHAGGPLLIVAGPGAGKTDVMVRRAAYLVRERGVPPDQILVTTFTNKAADELYDRLYRFGVLAHRFAGTFDPRQFEDLLREQVAGYAGEHEDAILVVPDLYRCLTNLLEGGKVHNEARAMVCQAIAYFITPFELFPKAAFGAEGYLDQAYLCLWTLNRLRSELPEHVLEEAWEGEGLMAKEFVCLASRVGLCQPACAFLPQGAFLRFSVGLRVSCLWVRV